MDCAVNNKTPKRIDTRNEYTILNISHWLKLTNQPIILVDTEYTGNETVMRWKSIGQPYIFYEQNWKFIYKYGSIGELQEALQKSSTSRIREKEILMAEFVEEVHKLTGNWRVDGNIEELYNGVNHKIPIISTEGYKSYATLTSLRNGAVPSLFRQETFISTSNVYRLVKNTTDYTMKEDQLFKTTGDEYIFICKKHGEFTNKMYRILYGKNACEECLPNIIKSEDVKSYKRGSPGYINWRKSVYHRDKYLCQRCKNKDKNKLVAHHLDGYHWNFDKRTDISNGITLCEDCHMFSEDSFHRTYGIKNNTKEQYMEWINNYNKKHTKGDSLFYK